MRWFSCILPVIRQWIVRAADPCLSVIHTPHTQCTTVGILSTYVVHTPVGVSLNECQPWCCSIVCMAPMKYRCSVHTTRQAPFFAPPHQYCCTSQCMCIHTDSFNRYVFHTHTHTCTHTDTYTHTRTHAHTCTHMHADAHAQTQAQAQAQAHTQIHARAHMHTHARTRTHARTHARRGRPRKI